MKVTTIILPAAALLSLVSASPIAEDSYDLDVDFNATSISNVTILEARKAIKSQDGTCVKGNDTGCKIKGGRRTYPCRNSNCKGKEGAKCWTGLDEKGHYVAKCPNNELAYEWEWPWKPT